MQPQDTNSAFGGFSSQNWTAIQPQTELKITNFYLASDSAITSGFIQLVRDMKKSPRVVQRNDLFGGFNLSALLISSDMKNYDIPRIRPVEAMTKKHFSIFSDDFTSSVVLLQRLMLLNKYLSNDY